VRKRILIVDDDVSAAEAAATILSENALYEVASEHDAERAIFVAQQFKPSAMLLNTDMAESASHGERLFS
jgi:PleD family two-component response regulator